MPSLSISLVDGILEGKGREEYVGAHPFYSKSKHKFNTGKKRIQGGFHQTENELIQSQCLKLSLVSYSMVGNPHI